MQIGGEIQDGRQSINLSIENLAKSLSEENTKAVIGFHAKIAKKKLTNNIIFVLFFIIYIANTTARQEILF
jgi:hypothetical protein